MKTPPSGRLNLHARIAAALGWTEQDVKSLSFQALREIVRPVSAKLAAELSNELHSGGYIVGEPLKKRARHG